MKTPIRILALLLATTVLAVACGSDAIEPTDAAGQAEPTSESSQETTGSSEERIETLWVGSELVDCIGEAPQKCMQIKRSVDGQVEWFYDAIDGFTHQVGTSYVLTVAVSDVEDPPADGSSLSYRLVEVVESTQVDTAADIADTSWTLTGFRDGNLFDAVPADVTITLTFEGDRINGTSGCNNYMSDFTAVGDEVSFGPIGGTKMMCAPAVMEQEDRYLPLLSAVETAEVTLDGMLVLKPATGPTLVFANA